MARRILIVDDEKNVRDYYEVVLKADHQIVKTDDGVEALRLLKEEHFDLVITDLQMPKMNGDTLSLEIKKARPHLPIIMVTSGVPGDHLCDVVLKKPILPFNLLLNVARATEHLNERFMG